jgi:VWFA-related protein
MIIKSRYARCAVLAMVCWLPLHGARAQAVPQSGIKVSVRLVTLDVVVTDRKGNPVTNLTPADFRVYEDAQLQTIKNFEPPSAHAMPMPGGKREVVVASAADLPKIGNAPVTLLVLDELNTAFSDMSFARQSLQKYLLAQPEILNQPMALLVANNNTFQLLQDYTQRRADLLAALARHFPEYPWKMANGGKGGPNAVERIVQSLGSLLQIAEATRGIPGRKSVIWVGVNAPGVDLSHADAVTTQQMTALVKRVTQTMLATRMAVFYINPTANSAATVGIMVPGDTSDEDAFVDVDPFSADINFDQLAPATGGRIFLSRNDVNNEIATSIDNGNTYYTVAYSPTNKSEDAAKFRNITVKLSNPELIATTREGYYAEPEDADNLQADTTLDPAQRRKVLQMEMSQAALASLAYNGLPLVVSKSADGTSWQLSVAGRTLAWTPEAGDKVFAEVTAMAVAFADQGRDSAGRYKADGRSRMLSHLSRELQEERGGTSAVPETVLFTMPLEVPPGTTRVRFVLRDAVSGSIGTFDWKP